jgi:hypothetical protein
MDRTEFYHLTARLRRQFPRVMVVLDLCDWAEQQVRVATTQPSTVVTTHVASTSCPVCERRSNKTEAMRKYRQGLKAPESLDPTGDPCNRQK